MKKIFCFICTIILVGCTDEELNIDDFPNEVVFQAQNACAGGSVNDANPTGTNTTLIWSDEFNDTSICEENWLFETIPPNNGSWFNNEQQYYTSRPSNATIENGALKIIAKKESYRGKEYTSARMTTQNLFEFQYGKVQIRAKLPQGQGTWPALWMLGSNIDAVGWPNCGEIDIMEHGDRQPGLISSTVHIPSGEPGISSYLSGVKQIQNESSEFHVYEVIWSEESIVFSVDDEIHHSYTVTSDMPFHQNFFLIFNVAMGGDFVQNNIDSNFVSAEMVIDYIRVYQ